MASTEQQIGTASGFDGDAFYTTIDDLNRRTDLIVKIGSTCEFTTREEMHAAS